MRTCPSPLPTRPRSPSRSDRWFDRGALGHPLWWGALVVLLINDNYLKGGGVVPGWLTGKLSDFAFLIVAPVLLAALLPRVLRGRRALALAAVSALYIAADLSPAVADGVVAAAGRLGFHWRLWPDPSDLLALAVLPFTVWLLRRPALVGTPEQGRARYWRERAGVVVGAAACLATSAPPSWMHWPFLVNRTSADTAVTVTWVLKRITCGTTPEQLAATLDPGDLDDPSALTLTSGQVASLQGPTVAGQSAVGVCSLALSYDGHCVAAILQAEGADPVVMVAHSSWFESQGGGFISCSCDSPQSHESQCAPTLDPAADPGPDAISLGIVAGQLRFHTASQDRSMGAPARFFDAGAPPPSSAPQVAIAAIDLVALAARSVPPDSCRSTRDDYQQLAAATSCQTHADCRSLAALVPPGEALMCNLFVNAGAADMLSSLAGHWQATCNGGQYCGNATGPAGCVAGTCAEVCVGRYLPPCPPDCRGFDVVEGHSCAINIWCVADDGRRCVCNGGVVTCAADAPPTPDCPFTCIPSTVDAGATPGGADARTDGGADGADSSDASDGG
jgi:hypothetical protein